MKKRVKHFQQQHKKLQIYAESLKDFCSNDDRELIDKIVGKMPLGFDEVKSRLDTIREKYTDAQIALNDSDWDENPESSSSSQSEEEEEKGKAEILDEDLPLEDKFVFLSEVGVKLESEKVSTLKMNGKAGVFYTQRDNQEIAFIPLCSKESDKILGQLSVKLPPKTPKDTPVELSLGNKGGELMGEVRVLSKPPHTKKITERDLSMKESRCEKEKEVEAKEANRKMSEEFLRERARELIDQVESAREVAPTLRRMTETIVQALSDDFTEVQVEKLWNTFDNIRLAIDIMNGNRDSKK